VITCFQHIVAAFWVGPEAYLRDTGGAFDVEPRQTHMGLIKETNCICAMVTPVYSEAEIVHVVDIFLTGIELPSLSKGQS
jgi:hypothetical protein